MLAFYTLAVWFCASAKEVQIITNMISFLRSCDFKPSEMLVLSLRQNGFRGIESLLSLPNRALIVQRIVYWHWQTRKSSFLSEFTNVESDGKADSRFPSPKRVDSPWKVGAHVSAVGGMENAVSNAVSIGSVTHRWCY